MVLISGQTPPHWDQSFTSPCSCGAVAILAQLLLLSNGSHMGGAELLDISLQGEGVEIIVAQCEGSRKCSTNMKFYQHQQVNNRVFPASS